MSGFTPYSILAIFGLPLKDVWGFTPPEILANFGPTPLFQLLEAFFCPKRRPKILNFHPTPNCGHFWVGSRPFLSNNTLLSRVLRFCFVHPLLLCIWIWWFTCARHGPLIHVAFAEVSDWQVAKLSTLNLSTQCPIRLAVPRVFALMMTTLRASNSVHSYVQFVVPHRDCVDDRVDAICPFCDGDVRQHVTTRICLIFAASCEFQTSAFSTSALWMWTALNSMVVSQGFPSPLEGFSLLCCYRHGPPPQCEQLPDRRMEWSPIHNPRSLDSVGCCSRAKFACNVRSAKRGASRSVWDDN